MHLVEGTELAPSHRNASASGRVHLAARSLEFVRPHRRRLGAVVLLALLLAGASAADPLILKYLFDQLGQPGGLPAFGTAAMVGLLALELARAGSRGGWGVESGCSAWGRVYPSRTIGQQTQQLCRSRSTSAKAWAAR